MKVAVGSTNPVKINAAKQAFKKDKGAWIPYGLLFSERPEAPQEI